MHGKFLKIKNKKKLSHSLLHIRVVTIQSVEHKLRGSRELAGSHGGHCDD
jgi:hypothetical protein